MKIVLNKCFGGFSLSEEQALAYGFSEHELYQGLNEKVYYGDMDRTDPQLVSVVEQGLKNSWASDLVVVEIPDECYWSIEDYDGHETLVWSESEINYA
jgi:hypothetical protein